MRETFGSLQQEVHDYTQTTNEAGTINTFIQKEINSATRFIYADLRDYVGYRTQTASTVADQQYYHNPPDLGTLVSVKITIGSVDYVLTPVDSADKWAALNAVTVAVSAIPRHFYPRRDDFGIYPIPQDAYTMTIEYAYVLGEMDNTDYTTGTITVTNNSTAVTGAGTSWSGNTFAAQWLKAPDGLFYRIESIDSDTTLTLESVYEGSTEAGASYTIGDSPEIPPDLHELIAYRAAARYYGGFRKDPQMATYWENMFWTGDGTNTSRAQGSAVGGYLGAKERYSTRSDNAIVYFGSDRQRDPWVDKLWGVQISTQ